MTTSLKISMQGAHRHDERIERRPPRASDAPATTSTALDTPYRRRGDEGRHRADVIDVPRTTEHGPSPRSQRSRREMSSKPPKRRHGATGDDFARWFWAQVQYADHPGCWEWTRHKSGKGYGGLKVNGVTFPAHRIANELAVRPIPEGLTIDHLCRNPACVNPIHLEAVDLRTNILRGISPVAVAARRTTCARGHPFDRQTAHQRVCRRCQWVRRIYAEANRKAGPPPIERRTAA